MRALRVAPLPCGDGGHDYANQQRGHWEVGLWVAVGDGIHDLGGMHGFGAVVAPRGEAPYHERWEACVFALHLLVDPERLGAEGA